MGENNIDKVRNEGELLNFLDHPHIVKYKQVNV
jgi:hypothetical protein